MAFGAQGGRTLSRRPYRGALAGKNVTVEVSAVRPLRKHKLTAVRDEDGRLLGGMRFIQDVTQSRAYQRELLESL